MSIKFVTMNDIIQVSSLEDGTMLDKLPVYVYTVKFSDKQGFFLQKTKEDFELPDKIYGDIEAKYKKIEKLYNSSHDSMGVLLTGLKGTSKTTLTKFVSKMFIAKNVPVVLVQDKFAGSDFMEFIDNLGEIVILFDEFAKTYSPAHEFKSAQKDLLTLFDGVYSSKRLVLLTDNNISDIDTYMLNRPSRIMLHWNYNRLDALLVKQYCDEELTNKDYIKDILSLYKGSSEFNFDSLKALVSCCNLFNGDMFEDIIDGLNIYTSPKSSFEPISLTDIETLKTFKKGLKILPPSAFDEEYSFSVECPKLPTDSMGFGRSNVEHFSKHNFVSDVNNIVTLTNRNYTLVLKRIDLNETN